VRDPQAHLPRSIYVSSGVISGRDFTSGTMAVPPWSCYVVNTHNGGLSQALGSGSAACHRFVRLLAALFGPVAPRRRGRNGAGVAACDVRRGHCRYGARGFRNTHPSGARPYVWSHHRARVVGAILLVQNLHQKIAGAYEILITLRWWFYFNTVPLLFAAVIKLAYNAHREQDTQPRLIPAAKRAYGSRALLGSGHFLCPSRVRRPSKM